jgi:triphosphoribosyl-dephospho-CoA synthase
MALLAEFPDTHIRRKFGSEIADRVRDEARVLRPQWTPFATAKSLPVLQDFDAKLKHEGLNPGTTADFVVTTLFADALIERKDA